MRFMSPQQKNTANSWLSWIARGVLIYFATLINSKLESIEKMQRQIDVHENRIVHLEENQKDITNTIRMTENRVNRIERAAQFKRGDIE